MNFKRIYCPLLLVIALVSSLQGQVWTGAGTDNEWFNPNNWNGGFVPNSPSADVTIGAPSPTLLDSPSVDVELDTLFVNSSGILTLDDSILEIGSSGFTNAGLVDLTSGSRLFLSGTVNNSGTIEFNGNGSSTSRIVISGTTTTLTGGGELVMQTGNVFGDSTAPETLNIVNQTIRGSGAISSVGTSGFTINLGPNSLIDATGLLDVSPDDLDNDGILQASANGTLTLASGVNNSNVTLVSNNIIQALDTGRVNFEGRLNISGGQIRSFSNRDFTVGNNGINEVKFSDLSIDADMEVTGGSTTLVLEGTITNEREIVLVNSADIGATGGIVTLQGGGTIELDSNSLNSEIEQFGAGNTLLILNGQTIAGRGVLGGGLGIEIRPGSIVEARNQVSGQRLRVEPGPQGLVNCGTMQSTQSNRTLELSGDDNGLFDNNFGTIQTVGANSFIELTNGAVVEGGEISSNSISGEVSVPDFESATLRDLSLDTNLEVRNNSILTLDGEIDNAGSIEVIASNNFSRISIPPGNTIIDNTNSGSITLNSSGFADASITGAGTLFVNGGDFAGDGQVSCGINLNGVDISPGNQVNPIGTLTFNTSPQVNSNSEILIDINAANSVPGVNADQLVVNGTLNLSGFGIRLATVAPLPDFDPAQAYRFQIATATNITGAVPGNVTTAGFGVFSGSFSAVVESLGGGGQALFIDYTPAAGDVLGDLNGDGVVNLLDVEPFIAAVGSGNFVAAADINQDGAVNLLDVDPFIDLLSS